MIADKILIPLGEDSTWCRELASKNGLPMGLTKKLTLDSKEGSLGEYLILLLINGYILRFVEGDEFKTIEALSVESILEQTKDMDLVKQPTE